MELPDYKMVQGGNTRVNMSAGAASQVGKAFASMGKDLEDAGMEVSGLFEEAERQHNIGKMADLQLELDQTRSEFDQKMMSDPNGAVNWRQGWDDVMAKKQKEIDAREMSGTLRDQTNLYVKGFSGKQGISVSHTAHKALLENARDSVRAVAVDARIRDDYDTSDAHWDKAYSEGLINKAEHTEQKLLNARGREKYKVELKMKSEKVEAKDDPAGYLESLSGRKDLDNDEQDKLASYATTQRNLQARSQLDDHDEAILSEDGMSLKDFDQRAKEGKYSQVEPSDLARIRSGMERGLPLSNTESAAVNAALADLKTKKGTMTTEEYMPYYNSKSAEIMGMIGTSKGYGYVTNALYTRNPFYKKDTGNLLAQNKRDNKDEGIALLNYHLKRGDLHTAGPEGKPFNIESLEDKEASGKIQRELQREANEYIDSQTEHLDTKEFATWLGRKINSKRGASEYKRNNGIKAPERKVVPNTFKDRNPHSLKNKSWQQQQRDTSTGKVSNSANFGGSSGWTGGKTQQEVERNLVSITSPSGAKFKVNKTVAGNFASFIEELEDVVGYPINAESSAGYNWRKKRGKSSLSQHSYGNAIDINWNENKAFWGGEDAISKIPNIDEIAAKHGLVWGGSWKNKDTMQFEYHPSTGVPAREV